MKEKFVFATAGLALMFGTGNALAQDDDSEATMRLMDQLEAKLPDAVTKPIVLPEHLAEDSAGVLNSEAGRLNAMDKRDTGRQEGLKTADEASAHGFEMRESAQEDRENLGRSEENRPEPPETPEPPSPPAPPSGG
jgi:hypothetical protein